ncbi:hypothetical protein B0H13DRAFT_2443380 [Mycena leptocephala]|nr:hypothetical protein B0H13DRAFT_2443380 [Mycena leptocephala]
MVGATEVLARTLAVELTPIRANVIVAGPVLSDLLEKLAGGKEGLLKVAAGTLTKQVGPPEGIAEAYLFCMRSSLATGQGFIVDNGVSLAVHSLLLSPLYECASLMSRTSMECIPTANDGCRVCCSSRYFRCVPILFPCIFVYLLKNPSPRHCNGYAPARGTHASMTPTLPPSCAMELGYCRIRGSLVRSFPAPLFSAFLPGFILPLTPSTPFIFNHTLSASLALYPSTAHDNTLNETCGCVLAALHVLCLHNVLHSSTHVPGLQHSPTSPRSKLTHTVLTLRATLFRSLLPTSIIARFDVPRSTSPLGHIAYVKPCPRHMYPAPHVACFAPRRTATPPPRPPFRYGDLPHHHHVQRPCTRFSSGSPPFRGKYRYRCMTLVIAASRVPRTAPSLRAPLAAPPLSFRLPTALSQHAGGEPDGVTGTALHRECAGARTA